MRCAECRLLAVAGGQRTARDIARVSQIEPASLPYYLKQLTELGYVRRRYPLTGEKKSPRNVRYDLGDPLLRFWFRFVFPEQRLLRRLRARRALRERVKPRLDAYFGHCFERLCREALPWLYDREGLDAAFEIGEYWSKTAQIDVVGLRHDGWTDLGEFKWGAVGAVAKTVRELEEKSKLYPNRRNATLGLRIFSRRPCPVRKGPPPGVRWHTLEELYEGDAKS